jgi:hypothetical protein
MNDPWGRLHASAGDALDWLWQDLAKEGRESAVFAPLAGYPTAAAWLATSMAMSPDYIARKLGAMLAGWIDAAEHSGLLRDMLSSERKLFSKDPLTANSVGDDIMFAATRWSRRPVGDIHDSGLAVLVEMIHDALHGTPWNTVNWATANLYAATGGRHEFLDRVQNATDEQLEGQPLLKNVAEALRARDEAILNRLNTAPSPFCELHPQDPNYARASELWEAAAAAEDSLD